MLEEYELMMIKYSRILEGYTLITQKFPWLITLLSFSVLVLFAWLVNMILGNFVFKFIKNILPVDAKEKALNIHEVIINLFRVVPLLIIIFGTKIIPGIPGIIERLIENISKAFIIVVISMALSSIIDIFSILHHKKTGPRKHSIKGYIQLVKIIIAIITIILVVAELIDKSPAILLSSLGAMAAVLMLVFQDTLLSLVASLQISSNDMVRVGDWIEMPNSNADGEVVEVALYTVKVRNWDNTITTLPTRKLITDSFKNWRNMEDSGGRRIKRSIYFDYNSIRYLSKDEIHKIKDNSLLKEYFEKKDSVNGSDTNILNIDAFCAYAERYIFSREDIHQEMTILVRQLDPDSKGLPIEIYCFSNNTMWVAYEAIKADIFNHLFSILPDFGLKVFQNPSGLDLQHLLINK